MWQRHFNDPKMGVNFEQEKVLSSKQKGMCCKGLVVESFTGTWVECLAPGPLPQNRYLVRPTAVKLIS